MLMALTCGRLDFLRKASGSKLPFSSRVPKYPEPNSHMMSASWARWYLVSPPSPVSCANPPMAAPLFMASTAFLDREPKLMEEMFSSEASYGCLQSGPPRRTRCSLSGAALGATDWTKYS